MAHQRLWLFITASVSVGAVPALAFGIPGFTGSPSLLAPAPLSLLAPVSFVLTRLWPNGGFVNPIPFFPVIASLSFAVWSWPIAGGQDEPPPRTVRLHRSIAAVSAIYFAYYWRYGVRYQGLLYTVGTALVSAALFYTLERLTRRLSREPRWHLNLAYHWLVFAWLFSYAFPWLGETL